MHNLIKPIRTALLLFVCTAFNSSLNAQFARCYTNAYNLKLNTNKTSINTCKDTIQLSVSFTGNPTIYWTDGYTGSSRVIYSSGVFQAYAYDSTFTCIDTSASVSVSLNDAYIKAYSSTYTNPSFLCSGSNINLYAYSTGLVKWNTGDSTNTILVNKAGKYFATMKSVNGCTDTSEVLEVIVNSTRSLNIRANSDTVVCLGDSVELELTTKYGYTNHYWNPYYNTNKIVKIAGSGKINVWALDSATGCGLMSNSIEVKVLRPSVESLCMVTVDSLTGKNKLVWKVTPNQRTSSYQVYRESNFAGEFDLIGNVTLKNGGEFIDSQSNPKQRPFTYYIEAIDSCNNRSTDSRYYAHTTLHLTANLGVNGENNLNWSNYLGIYPLTTYVIYRSNNKGAFKAIASVAASVNSFSDLDPPANGNRYYIGIKGITACDTSGRKLSVNSNMVAFGLLSTDETNVEIGRISPNPCSDFLNVTLNSSANTKLHILNVQGARLMSVDPSNNRELKINVGHLAPGIYLLNNDFGAAVKFIKE